MERSQADGEGRSSTVEQWQRSLWTGPVNHMHPAAILLVGADGLPFHAYYFHSAHAASA